jgi:sugar lactone lactonase YvrE
MVSHRVSAAVFARRFAGRRRIVNARQDGATLQFAACWNLWEFQPADMGDVRTGPGASSRGALQATLLRPQDDVATALTDLAAGTTLSVSNGSVVRTVTLRETIRTGHKLAVRDLAAGLRIRKYGEFIGRTTAPVPAGAWVHEHNLATAAHHTGEGRHAGLAWYDAVETASVLGVIGTSRATVGENPLYDERTDALWRIDVRETPAIHRIDRATGGETSWVLGEDIGSIALLESDPMRLLAALRSGFAVFDSRTGAMTPLVDPEADLPLNRMNDGKCDPAGRFWCGSMNPDAATADGRLWVLDPGLRCTKVLDDFLTPNGMTWSLDGRTLFLADTRRGYIYAFAFDVAAGTLGERRIFADLGAMPGGPDGATLDADGYLWSAQFDGGCIVRYAPDGRIDRVVRVPVTKPTACAFGGPGYRDFYVTSATRGMSEDEKRGEPDAGRVLVLDVGVAGMRAARFDLEPSVPEPARTGRSETTPIAARARSDDGH